MPCVLGRVDVHYRIGTLRRDFTDDPELAGIDLAREHLGGQRRHALVVFEDRAGAAVGANGRVDSDPHVQPLVAVDDVIAAAAHKNVAAVAAEHDVTAVEGGNAGARAPLAGPRSGRCPGRQSAAEVAGGAAEGERRAICGHVLGPSQHVIEARA